MNLAGLRAWCTSQNDVLGILQKMVCLACFLNDVLKVLGMLKMNEMFSYVFDHGALVNCGLY